MSRAKNEAMLRHGFALMRIFPHAAKLYEGHPVGLYKRVHRLEAEAHSFAERCCNEYIPDDKQARKDASILKRLDAILGYKAAGIPIFLNGDPRGYAIKIRDEYVRANNLEIERDWGGYGIICPEF
jgi:hypothetical protein